MYRGDADYIENEPDLRQHGLYMLIGRNYEHQKRKVYIGQTQDLSSRLKQHIRYKDFWEYAIVFTRISEQLNRSHV